MLEHELQPHEEACWSSKDIKDHIANTQSTVYEGKIYASKSICSNHQIESLHTNRSMKTNIFFSKII